MSLLFLVAIFLLAYAGLILFYWYQWLITPVFKPSEVSAIPVSVVVAARNEEQSLPVLLESLQQQSYPVALTEVIIVDDYSTDRTREAIKPFLNERIQCITPPVSPGESSKKKAINTGVRAAQHELIVITDADCIVPVNWLQSVVTFYNMRNVSFIAAPVRFSYRNTMLELLQAMDFMVLQGITAAAVSSGFHTMANGANLAYTKSAFDEVNGFEGVDQLASGDDLFLMQKIWRKDKQQVGYLKSEAAIVSTPPMHSWKSFVNQRRRWASKSAYYTDAKLKAVLVFVYLFNLLFPVLIIAALFNPIHWWLVLYYLVGKIVIELPFVYSVAKFYKEEKLIPWFFLLQPVHIVYTIVVGLISQFGSYEWKSRRTK